MEPIKLTFLGTGSAIPTKNKNHPGFFLRYKDENILVDCGEGTQRQFRLASLNPCKITKILITHWHGDHVLGLPGLLQTLMLNNYNRTLQIYGPHGTKRMIELYLDLFVGKGDQLKIQVQEVSPGVFVDGKEFQLQAQEAYHDAPTLAYSFIIKEKNRLNKAKLKKLKIPNSPLIAQLLQGKTIEINKKKINPKNLLYKEKQRKVTFIMDTLSNPKLTEFAKDSDLLICESTYSKEEKETAKEYFHLTSEDAAEIAKKSKSKKLALVHISQRYESKPKLILNEAKKVFKNTIVPNDLDNLTI